MRALDVLAKARSQGAKPAVTFVTLGNVPQFPWWADGTPVEIVIPDDMAVARMDFRPLVGCDVILIAWRRDARLRAATELLCAQAARLTVLSSDDADDLGHVWERGTGWRKFGERRAA
jgi:hypothetical protein